MPTLKDLRDLAKSKGVSGYSKLAKDDLITLLKQKGIRVPADSGKKASAKKASAKKATPKRTSPKTSPKSGKSTDSCAVLTKGHLKAMNALLMDMCLGEKVKGKKELHDISDMIVAYFEKYPIEKK